MANRPSSAGSADEHPHDYCCPISGQLMHDPVVLVQTGHTFERANIQKWFAEGKDVCPMTSIKLQSIQLTPNYGLKGAINSYLEKRQRSGAQASTSHPSSHAQSSYPRIDGKSLPTVRQTHVKKLLETLRGASIDIRGFRNQREYELWTLSKLVHEDSCLQEFMSEDGPKALLRYLDADNAPGVQGAAAQIVATVAKSSRGQEMYQAVYSTGGLSKLVALLTNEGQSKQGQLSNRESAAVALQNLAAINSTAQGEVLFDLCAASTQPSGGGRQKPSFLAPMHLLFSSNVSSEKSAAAKLAAQVIRGMNLQEYREYSSCEGTQTLPCLVSLLPGPESLSSGAVLSALMYTSNQASVFHHLVDGLSDTHLRDSAGILLWEAIAANSALVGVLNQILTLPGALEAALRARTLIGAGLTQLVTCDFPRTSNSAVLPPNTDDMRLRLISQQQIIPALVEMMHSQDQQTAQAATHALANLAAFRSGTHSTESRLSIPSRRPSQPRMRPNHPSSLIAHSEALPRLLGLLNCPQASIVGPSLALLNNLCAENDLRDRVKEAANQYGYEQIKGRLEGLRGWAALPDSCRVAARTCLHRLEERRNERPPQQYTYITLLMRPPH